jgi:hypothetical protein
LRHLARTLALALAAGLLMATPVTATTAASGTAAAGVSTTPAISTGLSSAKVAIIVGATGSATSNYRSIADSAYATAIQYSSNVVKVYSPNATWSAAVAAMTGASVIIYLGHGNGWPAPYPYDPSYSTKDGLGLNAAAGQGDYNVKYYGEPYLAKVKFAPNAVVLLNHLCYASGNSESGNPDPTLSVAMQRVDNYGQGFIKAGARAVIAEGHGSINGMIRDLFTTHQAVVDMWRNQWDYNGHEFSFQSSRNPAYTAFMDPDQVSGGYWRSLIGNPDLLTDDVTGVPYVATDPVPDTMSPQLWGADGPKTISPNGDGVADTLALALRFSETVDWSATFRNDADATLWSDSGSGDQGDLSWDLQVGGSIIPDGAYTLTVTAADAAGNPPMSTNIGITVDSNPPRLGGVDRYATAAAISAATYGPGVEVAYLATGANFPDALAGAAAAGSQGAPVLLVTKDAIPAATAAELARLKPGRIVILGSTGVVSEAVRVLAERILG